MAAAGKYQESNASHYVWWFPGCPVKVHLSLDVVDRLGRHLRAVNEGQADQGLLLGNALGSATEVLDFEPAGDRSVSEMIAELPDERSLIGYYRLEDGESLRLNHADVSLASLYFPKAYQVFLLIQRNGAADFNAAFFFRDGREQMGEIALLEFPFNASLLAAERHERIWRHDQSHEEPVEQPKAERHTPAEAFSREEVFNAEEVFKSPVPTKAMPAPFTPPEVHENIHDVDRRRRSLRIGVCVCVVALILSGTVWMFSSRSKPAAHSPGVASNQGAPSASTAPGTGSSHSTIGLRAKRQDGDLEVTWNRDSALLSNATSATLSIDDGGTKRKLTLDSRQLRNGSVLYSPGSDQVVIQMAIDAPAGPVTESVGVILPKSDRRRNQASRGSRSKGRLEAEVKAVKTAPIQQARPEGSDTPASIQHSAKPSQASPTPAKNVTAGKEVSPAQSPPAAPANSASRVEARVPRSSAYSPPEPISRVTPVFPADVSSTMQKPEIVDVYVTVDRSGNVVRAEAEASTQTHPPLVDSAVHAARLWRFQPARSGQQPVEGEVVLRFTFSPKSPGS